MGEVWGSRHRHPGVMHVTSEQTAPIRPARGFWWDRARPLDADLSPLRAVILDADALGDPDGTPRTGLIDLVMSLFVAGIWVGVVSAGRRDSAGTLVRHLIGDGLVETVVSADDVTRPDDTELYRLALWELGITADSALAIVGSERGYRAAAAAGLPIVVGAADVGYDGLSVEDCRRLQRRSLVGRLRRRAASR